MIWNDSFLRDLSKAKILVQGVTLQCETLTRKSATVRCFSEWISRHGRTCMALRILCSGI